MILNQTSLNKHWDLKSLDELGSFKRGKSKHRPRNDIKLFEDGDIPLIQTGDIKAANLYISKSNDFYNEFGLKQSKLWDKGTLCITIAANIAETAILKEKMAFPDSVVGFIPFKNKTTSEYMHYLFSFIRYSIQNSVQGSIQDNINIDYLTRLKFRIPSFQTQQKIATVLSALDAKIELNNRINAELEQMAKTLYDYWFVQFDFPFDFAQGRTDKNGKPYKSSGGKMVYDKTLKREIPEGWEGCKLGYVIENTRTGLNPRQNFILGEGENYYVTIKNIKQGKVVLDEKCDKISDESLEIINKRSDLKVGDILYTSIEPVGTTYLLRSKPKNWNINESVFTIRPDYKKVSSEFLYMFLSGDYIKAYTKNVSAGSIHKGVRHSTLKDCIFNLPIKDVVNDFTQKISPILDKLEVIQKQNQKLVALRDWLLPMLMNGQVTVGEVEEAMDRAAEPEVTYGFQSFDEMFKELNFDFEVATVVLLTYQRFDRCYGKKYIHKMFSNIEMLNTLPAVKDLKFEEHGWGMFSKAIAKTLDKQVFVTYDELDSERNVIRFNYKHLKEVTKWMNGEGRELVKQVNDMLTIYEKPLIDKNMDRIELLNTVLECIKVTDGYDYEAIRKKMENWKMEEGDYKTKTDKFNEQETRAMIEFVKELKYKH